MYVVLSYSMIEMQFNSTAIQCQSNTTHLQILREFEGFDQRAVLLGNISLWFFLIRIVTGLDQAVTESQNCSCQEFFQLSHTASQSYYTSL